MILVKYSARRLLHDLFLEQLGLPDQFEKRKIVRKGHRHRYYTAYYLEIYDRYCSGISHPRIKRRKVCSRSQKKPKLKQWKR